MNRTDVVHALTLWFAAMIFLQTTSGVGGTVFSLGAVVAVVLTYGVPLALLAVGVHAVGGE